MNLEFNKVDGLNNNENLDDILHDIQKIYWSENIQLKTFPKWALLANSQELRKSVLDYILLTAGHVYYIESIFEILARDVKGKIDSALWDVLRQSDINAEDHMKRTRTADDIMVRALCDILSYQIKIYENLKRTAVGSNLVSIYKLIEKALNEKNEIFDCFTKLKNKIS